MTKKIFFHLHTGYCGEDDYTVAEFKDDATDEEISEYGYQLAINHAASYGHELCDADCEDEDCDREHEGSSNIEGPWVLYDPKKHNMYSIGGKGW